MQRGLETANDWDARVGVACPIILQARREGSWPIRGKGERPLPQTTSRSIHPHRERQTGKQTETYPIETYEKRETEKRSKRG